MAMNFLPGMSEIRKIAAEGKYRVLPVSCEILSDICTPIEALDILKNVSAHCYLLESAKQDETWGRYTFLGFDPRLEITCRDGEMKAGSISSHMENPSGYIRQGLADYSSTRFSYLPPFTGGLVGHFSYDYLASREPEETAGVRDPAPLCECGSLILV